MHLKKLSESFYLENTHLIQALDLKNGEWMKDKVRGYGIAILKTNNLRFGIPLHTGIKHKAAYLTQKTPSNKGLDFSKAVLLPKDSYISIYDFKIDAVEHNQLKKKKYAIIKKFEKYVSKYIDAINKNDSNILLSNEYKFTTLQNYHSELNVSVVK